jgi:hypothetical protein
MVSTVSTRLPTGKPPKESHVERMYLYHISLNMFTCSQTLAAPNCEISFLHQTSTCQPFNKNPFQPSKHDSHEIIIVVHDPTL